MKRGEVWLARLDPTQGRELQKTRPCVVVSPPEIHDHLSIVMAAPMTTGSLPAAFRVRVMFRRKQGLILMEQIRALDRRRLIRRLGAVDRETLAAVLTVLREMFAD